MFIAYNVEASKKPTNLSVNSDLLAQAKSLNINLSAVFEMALAYAVKERKAAERLAESADSIADYNKYIDESGLFSDDARTF